MSLIVDALKKAQEGVSRRLPPFSYREASSALPGWWGAGPGRRRVQLVAGLGLVVLALAGSLLYLTRLKSVSLGPPVRPPQVVEPAQRAVAPESGGQVAGQPAAPAPPKPERRSSIPEVRAALEAESRREEEMGIRKPPTPAERSPAAPARRVDPRREEALRRVKAALEQEAGAEKPKPPESAGQESASPRPPLPPPSRVERPPSPPTVLEVHPEGGAEASRFFADALRYQQRGQLARAIEQYGKSIEADPRNPAVFNNLGVALKETGQLDRAAEAFQKALALDPKYEKALNNLGVVRYRKGQYEEAIDLFRQALRINAANVESYTNLGIIYLQAERHEDALEAFQQALRHDPGLAEAHYNLALLWERRGHRENAVRHYRKFVELSSDRHLLLVAKVRERLEFLAQGR